MNTMWALNTLISFIIPTWHFALLHYCLGVVAQFKSHLRIVVS